MEASRPPALLNIPHLQLPPHSTGRGARHFDTRSLNEENFIASIGVYSAPALSHVLCETKKTNARQKQPRPLSLFALDCVTDNIQHSLHRTKLQNQLKSISFSGAQSKTTRNFALRCPEADCQMVVCNFQHQSKAKAHHFELGNYGSLESRDQNINNVHFDGNKCDENIKAATHDYFGHRLIGQ